MQAFQKADWDTVRQRGSCAVSRARALWAEQGLYIESKRERERARVTETVAERASGSQREPENEPVRASVSQRDLLKTFPFN